MNRSRRACHWRGYVFRRWLHVARARDFEWSCHHCYSRQQAQVWRGGAAVSHNNGTGPAVTESAFFANSINAGSGIFNTATPTMTGAGTMTGDTVATINGSIR